MEKTNQAVGWVVYRKTMSLNGKSNGLVSVCPQGEWDAMELANPGYHTLVRAGISNEPEAEASGEGHFGLRRAETQLSVRPEDVRR